MTGNWQKLTVWSVVCLPDLGSVINVLSISDHYTYSGIIVALYLESDVKNFNVFELGDQAGHHSVAPFPV